MELSGPSFYHYGVRTLFIVFMIALLPLRGWVGDAMALSMASQHPAQATTVTTTLLAPCHETVAGVETQGGHEAGHGAQDGGSHSHLLCDLCNGPALSLGIGWNVPTTSLSPLVPPVLERFASQDARRDVRPPIA